MNSAIRVIGAAAFAVALIFFVGVLFFVASPGAVRQVGTAARGAETGLKMQRIEDAAAQAGSTVQRDAPTTRFYTPDGRSAGSVSIYGNTAKFYGPDGRLIGSATTNGGRK